MADDLYQELILEYSKKQNNRGSLGAQAEHAHLRNPFCGDDIQLWVEFDGEKVKDVKFSGYGCLISQAAASMMADMAKGKTVEEVAQLSSDFRSLIKGEISDEAEERIGDLIALGGVRKAPARIRCAYLAFEALEQLLKDKVKNAILQEEPAGED